MRSRRGGCQITSLTELGLPHTKRLLKEMIVLHPHLYTLSNLNNWREGIPGLRKFLHTEILLWGLGERLLDIVENYIGLPLLFHGVDLRRDAADAPLTDARYWHRDIDDERMIKVIIYLNNVGQTGGPYEYIPRSFSEHLNTALDYKSGFIADEAIAKLSLLKIGKLVRLKQEVSSLPILVMFFIGQNQPSAIVIQ
ncbi:MAG: hypothetical protein HC763_29460 [Hydrococcus sp. CRU_1_1]|nr:hypothetical protein [Hydrococcus sp. CRU_1_1]